MFIVIISLAFCLVGFAIGYTKGFRDCFYFLDDEMQKLRELREAKGEKGQNDSLC